MIYLKINLLNEDTIQKIAAGEVVERPASIIKELVENSIDAKATEIIVEIKNGGKTFIKVSDDGLGINKDEIEKAFYRHATSKISNFDDLYKIYTMGFRGEALASIVAVSSLNIFSKTEDQEAGIHLFYDNNKLVSRKSIGMNRGTIIEVHNLFEYIPVRKKFLASDQAEANKITSLMYSFAIANEGISITYIRDDRLIFKTNKDNSLLDNLRILFGNDYADNTIEINSESAPYKLSGFISNNNFYKGNRSMQYLFVNGRYVEDSDLLNHIEDQYNNMIPKGRFPAFQMFIETDPKNVDINISPNKQKIKFYFADELYEEVKRTVIDALLEAQKIKSLKVEEKKSTKPNFYDLTGSDAYDRILEAYKEDKPSQSMPIDQASDVIEVGEPSDSLEILDLDDYEDEAIVIIEDEPLINLDNIFEDTQAYDDSQENFMTTEEERNLVFITSLFNKYLLFKEFSKDDLLIIDYIAANERLIFDDLTKSIEEDDIKISDLLSPIIIELGPKDYEKFEHNRELLTSLGFSIDDFGEDTIAVRSVPYIGAEPVSRDIFQNIFDNLSDHATKDEYILAVQKKALGQAIHKDINYNESQALELANRLEKSSNKFSTPNGRKIQFSLSEKEFERILNR